jgi:hypothetical protein
MARFSPTLLLRPPERSSSRRRRLVASRGPARDAGLAHRRQGAADDNLCGRDEAVHARDLEPLAEFQAKGADNYRQYTNTDALEHHDFAPLGEKMWGISSRSGIWPGINCLALAGISDLKLSEATSVPAFHPRISMVYCGHPVTFLLGSRLTTLVKAAGSRLVETLLKLVVRL